MDADRSSRSDPGIAAFESSARAIVGPEHVQRATDISGSANATNNCGGTDFFVCPWIRAADENAIPPKLRVEPANEQELAGILKLADQSALAVIPCGGGTKLAWGNPPQRADIILSTARLNAIVDYAWSDLTVTVEAGCTIQQLRDTLSQLGQRLALDPLWPSRATVGGVLSTNDSGVLRLRFGSLRDLIIGVTLALPDGTLGKSGGKVVKNVAGYDLPKLVTGALGTLGVITRATFRIHPMPKQSRTISCLARDVREAQRLVLAIQDSKLAHSALQIRFVQSMQPQIDVLFEATQAGLSAQIEQLKIMLAPAAVTDPGPAVWNARQELYSAAEGQTSNSALAKVSVLPTHIAEAYAALVPIAANGVHFQAVVEATGIGFVYFEATPAEIAGVLQSFRAKLEAMGGSLMIAHRPPTMPPLDAWGNPGDALPLMRAVKKQFDPKNTLNPGRFVGAI
jgi:glycolate oxidase FAD binding subunit